VVILAELGMFGVAVPEDAGGAGGTSVDLAAMFEQVVAELTLQLKGFHGACPGPEAHEFFLTRTLSIAGGSAQVLLSLVAKRLLGLPR
jgi:alkylation response protein AidB-like acyl-CoA dehydrogenase